MTGLSRLFGGSAAERQAKQKLTIRAIYITVVAIVLVIALLAVTMIVAGVNGKAPDNKNEFIKKEFTFDATKSGDLLIINKNSTAYSFDANSSSALISVKSSVPSADGSALYALRNDELRANGEALDALNTMIKDFYDQVADKTAAKRLTLWTAYRSYEAQAALNSSVPAGHSDFHTGMLFELTINGTALSISTDSTFKWIYENAYKYGFIERYPEEKSSSTGISDFDNAFRYVGVAHATYIHQNGLCLEEYISYLQNNAGKTLTVADKYEITYVKLSETEKVEVELPASKNYEISGDNMGGIIITVEK